MTTFSINEESRETMAVYKTAIVERDETWYTVRLKFLGTEASGTSRRQNDAFLFAMQDLTKKLGSGR